MDHTPPRLVLVLLPPGERRLEFAEPMGTPAILSTRIAELLPGTTFDADRRGTFRRGGYEITFDFVAERTAIAQATAIDVTVGSGEGFTALKRIVDKTGWQAVDPHDRDRGGRGRRRHRLCLACMAMEPLERDLLHAAPAARQRAGRRTPAVRASADASQGR